MPRSVANKNYRTFVAGMVTEASPLTYPENASTDELNCVIFQKGNRTRRLGFLPESENPEGINQLLGFADVAINEYTWRAVNETGRNDFIVQRIGNIIQFYDANTVDQDLAVARFDFTVDLADHLVQPSLGSSFAYSPPVEFSSGRGFLFVVGEAFEPFSVEVDVTTNPFEFTVRPIKILIRDFVGVDDGLANDFEPTTLSNEHHYNLRNQGWVAPSSKTGNTEIDPITGLPFYTSIEEEEIDGPFGGRFSFPTTVQNPIFSSLPIQQYFDQIGLYPANNKAWWVGRLEVDNPEKDLKAGDFDPDLLCDTFVGNTLAARGHHILDAFDQDRSAASGVPDIPTRTFRTRPKAISYYAGKVWFAYESELFYSQTLLDYRQAGSCYQEADPTSETISDLIATDGGQLPIPEAHNIKRIQAVGGSLVVFAENGVWSVQGGGGGFSALDVSVTKVSSNGILGPRTLVEANGVIYWWSPSGIMSLAQKSGLFGTQEGSFDRENITETTIRSFYHNNISEQAKDNAKGVYDPIRNVVQWLYQSDELLPLGTAFFQPTVPVTPVPGNPDKNPGVSIVTKPVANGVPFSSPNLYDSILNLDVSLNAFYPWRMSTTGEGRFITGAHSRTTVNVINTPGIETQQGANTFNSYVRFHYVDQTTASGSLVHGFGDFAAQNYADFGDTAYLSFMETGFELLDDLMRNKQSNYVFLYFRRTDDEDTGIESSCFFQTRWNWSRSHQSNKWSRLVQGYRITHRFDHSDVVSTKHKARGQGRAIQLRFESDEIGKTFDLLGWGTNYTGNTTV